MSARYIAFAVWLLAAAPWGLSENFPNRPTVGELATNVALGTKCAKGINERCWALQYQINPVAYRVAPFTNTAGFHLEQSLMGSMAAKIKLLVPYYIRTNTVYVGTTDIISHNVTSLWAQLPIGDRTNLFTQTPAAGTNNAVYGDYPWRIYNASLDERYQVLRQLRWSYADITNSSKINNYRGNSGGSYAEIADSWGGLGWTSMVFSAGFAAAWVDNYGSGPWSVMKFRGKPEFIAPFCATIDYKAQLMARVVQEGEGSPQIFLTFEAPGQENEYIYNWLDEFDGPLVPNKGYEGTQEYGNSAAIVPDPGPLAAGTVKSWMLKSAAIIKWVFSYCQD